MTEPLSSPRMWAGVCQRQSSPSLSDEPCFVGQWLLESWLLWAHWAGVPLISLLIPVFPTVAPLPTALLALGLGVGNAWAYWLLHQEPSPGRLRQVRRLATAKEWLAVLGVNGLLAHDPAAVMPALLLFLVLLSGARYGLRGVPMALVGATLTVGTLVASQVWIGRALSLDLADDILVHWLLLLGPMALVVGLLLHVNKERRRREMARWQRHDADLQAVTRRWLQSGLTLQEWRLLQLLADENLGYEQVGRQLDICSETVKVHVRHIAHKLDVTGGRKGVIAAARERGLLLAQRGY